MHKLRRLFFGCEVLAPWPLEYFTGRFILPASRHLTLAFLGNVDFEALEKVLGGIPSLPFKVGPVGFFDKCLMLPPKDPRVVAWHARWLEEQKIGEYQKCLADWLRSEGYSIDQREFLPHVSIARSPLDPVEWQKKFIPLPFIVSQIHLYESVGNLVYTPIRTYPITAPFTEIDHTADVAFLVRAETLEQLHLHAYVALAFMFPEFLRYNNTLQLKTELEDIVIALNRLVTLADSDGGCPLKAVSFHGDIKLEKGIYTWEMIVDV
ncbi:MAG: hypothetical protein WC222_01670 [Parachlamydiales bacterium]|jgi:2'-5' RNA ligase